MNDKRIVRACPRCGIKRETRPTTVLCADCRYVLTAAEAVLWRDDYRKEAA